MGTIKASKHCWPVYRTAARLGCIVAYHGTNITQTRTPAAESQSWAESHDSYRVNILPAQDYDSHDQLTTLGKQGGKPATTDRPCRRRRRRTRARARRTLSCPSPRTFDAPIASSVAGPAPVAARNRTPDLRTKRCCMQPWPTRPSPRGVRSVMSATTPPCTWSSRPETTVSFVCSTETCSGGVACLTG